MKAYRIPTNSSNQPEEINFDTDRLDDYVIAKYHEGRVFLIKRNAERDYTLDNSRATRLASGPVRKSDAARHPIENPKNLKGDVIVLAWDPLLSKVTGLTEGQVNRLTSALEWMDPTASAERRRKRIESAEDLARTLVDRGGDSGIWNLVPLDVVSMDLLPTNGVDVLDFRGHHREPCRALVPRSNRTRVHRSSSV
jgi:hypothetical protein